MRVDLAEQDCEHGLSAALCAGPGHYPADDRSYSPAASPSDAHSEWHRNAGVPSGDYGGSCPWDACGHGHAADYEAQVAAEEEARELAAYAPALREGELPAMPSAWLTYGPQPLDPWTAHWVASGGSWEDIPEPPF